MERVSIIIPVYNVEKYIKDCMDSVLSQSYRELDIILVDDGSSDNSPAICDAYQEKNDCVRVFHRKNAGVSAARNFGLSQAAGEYVLFVDADDTLVPNAVEENLKMVKAQDADLAIFGFCYHITDENRSTPNPLPADFTGTREAFFEKEFVQLLNQEVFNPPWNKFVKKSLLDEADIRFKEEFSICEDMIFSAELLAASKKTIVNHDMYYNYFIKSRGTLVFKFHDNYFEALSCFYERASVYCEQFAENKLQQKKVNTVYANLAIMFIKRICCESGWDKKRKLQKIRGICNHERFRGALRGADLGKKKKVVRFLINCKLCRTIHLLYKVWNR